MSKDLDIAKNVLTELSRLENLYKSFWKKIYYDDTYIYYKHAIFFYKNIQGGEFHDFFSGFINKRLYTGECKIADKDMRNTFSKNSVSSDDLCRLAIETINILDKVFDIAPKLQHETIVYRSLSNLDKNDPLLNIAVGKYYRSLGIQSTTINPYIAEFLTSIILTIILPENTKCYYMNIPTNPKWVIGNEYELVLPRDNVYKILSRQNYKGRILIVLQLVKQIDPQDRPILGVYENNLPTVEPYKISECMKNIKYNNVGCKYIKQIINKTDFYLIDRSINMEMNLTKFWMVVHPMYDVVGLCESTYNKLFSEKKINLKTAGYLHTKKPDIERALMDDNTNYFITKNNSNRTNKLYEIDYKMPMLYLLQITSTKPVKLAVQQKGNHIYVLCENIWVKFSKSKKISIINEFNYVLLNCTI